MTPIWEPQLSAPWPLGAMALLWLCCGSAVPLLCLCCGTAVALQGLWLRRGRRPYAEGADPTPRSPTLRPFRRAGKTIAENLADCPPLVEGQKIVSTFEKPVKPTGHIAILQVSAQVRG